MVLGNGLTDATGQRHEMAGLLSVETSFQNRKLHLGYRDLHVGTGRFKGHWLGHEFHYATTMQSRGQPFMTVQTAEGTALPPMGLTAGRVSGSFAHLIDKAP